MNGGDFEGFEPRDQGLRPESCLPDRIFWQETNEKHCQLVCILQDRQMNISLIMLIGNVMWSTLKMDRDAIIKQHPNMNLLEL